MHLYVVLISKLLYANHRYNNDFSLNKSHLVYMRVMVVVVGTSLPKGTQNPEISVKGIKKIELISSVLRLCSP